MAPHIVNFGRGVGSGTAPTPPNTDVPTNGVRRNTPKAIKWAQTRHRIAPASAKRIEDRPARRALREEVVARDGVCQLPRLIEAVAHELSEADRRELAKLPECAGDLVPHEPKHSRNVGRLNAAEAIALCYVHNQVVETMGALAYRIGVLQDGVSYPLSHVRTKEAS